MGDAVQDSVVALGPEAQVAPRKPNRRPWIIAGIATGVLVLCAVACAAILATGYIRVITETPAVQSKLDVFMRDMEAKDAKGAFALFSPRAQRVMPRAQLDKLLEGNNYVLFDGYGSLSIDSLNISLSVNPDPDVPQGTVAEVTGTIAYDDGSTGTLTATLEKVNGTWMIDNFFVTVPPSKVHL